nr:MAG TPA: hypothetical protein [Caudoviricetes sp.]
MYSSIAAAQSAVGLAKFARIDLSLLPDSEDLIPEFNYVIVKLFILTSTCFHAVQTILSPYN